MAVEKGGAALVPAAGLGARAVEVAGGLRARVGNLPPGKRNTLLLSLAALLAFGAALAWYAGRPDWRVLFSGLEGKDAQTVSSELGATGIPFRPTADGTGVEVPADQLDKARIAVAAKGMPGTGRLGFELFDKPNWVGSEFDERVNYQRALEGELEHTIATLGAVRSARVHLVLPAASVFSAEEKVAKASVVLKLKRASLAPEQTEAIRNLVAGAVENLSPDEVTLVDADGRVNLAERGRGALDGDTEEAMEAKLVAMLEPLAGAGNVRATVKMTYELGSEERTDEVYDPAQTATLTSQHREQTSRDGRGEASGVPGTASNTPAAAPAGAVQGSVQAAAPGTPPLLQAKGLPVYPGGAGGALQSSKEDGSTFAVTKHVVHTEGGPGRVRRVSAALVVNDRMATEGTGKALHTVWKSRTADEMHRLEGLAQAAVGFDAKRGDQVVVENLAFSANTPEVKPGGVGAAVDEAKGLLSAQPGLLRTGIFGLVALLAVWFVFRPLASQVAATLGESARLPANAGAQGADDGQILPLPVSLASGLVGGDAAAAADRTPALGGAEAEASAPRPRPGLNQAVFEQVSRHIRREPGQSTRLLETWIGTDEEAI